MNASQRQRVEQLEREMREITNSFDIEEDHVRADQILCEALEVLGAADLASEFHKVKKWYA